jgi:hypothetical protein
MGPTITSICMPVAGQWKGCERQPRYCETRRNKAYLPPEKSFLRRRPFKLLAKSTPRRINFSEVPSHSSIFLAKGC